MIYEEVLGHIESRRLIAKFKRKLPRTNEYKNRLYLELELIIKKKFVDYLLQVVEILDIVNDIPHIIRGSSGSSLVCYCLGITNIDPVKENICFARFLNEKRETMPDIDMDFPYNKREKVFKRLNKRYPNKIARISNHIYYKEKSAIREAIRQVMIEKNGKSSFIPKEKCNINYKKDWKDLIIKKKEELLGEFKNYSLHCGGIVYYPDGIPDNIKLKNIKDDVLDNQIVYNKDDISNYKLFKIDILSNRGLAQLYDSNMLYNNIEDYPDILDKKITKLFKFGYNLGLTFAESPAMRKLLTIVEPKNLQEIAICLALVRPMVESKFSILNDFENYAKYIIFDDDAIKFIKDKLNCSDSKADEIRRVYAKRKFKKINYYNKIFDVFLVDKLKNLEKYSFCKSHAISYAKLVLALAYQKLYKPQEFWLSTLNHCHSMYYKWVHYREASQYMELTLGKKPWILKDNKLISNTNDKLNIIDSYKQLKMYGYWISKEFLPNMYLKLNNSREDGIECNFRGLVAMFRIHKKSGKTFITIGYDNYKYVDLIIDGICRCSYIVSGKGILRNYIKSNKKVNLNSNGLLITDIHLDK
jgi:DNA polymerase III alpha subunit